MLCSRNPRCCARVRDVSTTRRVKFTKNNLQEENEQRGHSPLVFYYFTKRWCWARPAGWIMESAAGDNPQLHTTLDIYWGSWKGYWNYVEHLCSTGNFLAMEMPCADRPDLSSGKWHWCHHIKSPREWTSVQLSHQTGGGQIRSRGAMGLSVPTRKCDGSFFPPRKEGWVTHTYS